MIVSIAQPAYLPWLGYFARIALSDVHVVLDHVQFEKNSMTNRNKVKTPQGWCWLTVPVLTKGACGEIEIDRLMVNNKVRWQTKHWKTIQQCYAKSPFFLDYAPKLEHFFLEPHDNLNCMLRGLTKTILDLLGISTEIRYSSEMHTKQHKSGLVLEICTALGATTYISGPFGRNYLIEETFHSRNIRLVYHDYEHPQYPQLFEGFMSHLSVIDLLFNCGPASLEILMKNQKDILA